MSDKLQLQQQQKPHDSLVANDNNLLLGLATIKMNSSGEIWKPNNGTYLIEDFRL